MREFPPLIKTLGVARTCINTIARSKRLATVVDTMEPLFRLPSSKMSLLRPREPSTKNESTRASDQGWNFSTMTAISPPPGTSSTAPQCSWRGVCREKQANMLINRSLSPPRDRPMRRESRAGARRSIASYFGAAAAGKLFPVEISPLRKQNQGLAAANSRLGAVLCTLDDARVHRVLDRERRRHCNSLINEKSNTHINW